MESHRATHVELLYTVSFLFLHLVSLGTEIFALYVFGSLWLNHRSYFWAACFVIVFAVFALSGIWCSVCAWDWKPFGRPLGLPLKALPRWQGILLLVPYGVWQIIIVRSTVDEFQRRRQRRHSNRTLREQQRSQTLHGKAVLGMIEGFLTALCLICTILGITRKKSSPIIHHSVWDYSITFAVPVLLVSAGTGLLVLDQCLSKRLSVDSTHVWEAIPRSVLHVIFRSVEVYSRATVFAIFVAILRADCQYILTMLLGFDLMVTLCLIAFHGGSETTWSVRLVCAIPCIFADIFFFIDSPYKRMAARKLSSCLMWRSLIEVCAMILVTRLLIKPDALMSHMSEIWDTNGITMSLCVVTLLLYPMMYYWAWRVRRGQRLDIFTACEQGNSAAVTALTTDAAVGFSLDCRDVFGKTPLMLAATHGHADICHTLLKEGATVDAFTQPIFSAVLRRPYSNIALARSKWTAAHFAAEKGHAHVLRVLLQHMEQAEVMRTAKSDCTSGTVPLLESQLVEATIRRTARTLKDTWKCTPLHIAAWRGHLECVLVLTRSCPNMVLARDDGNQTPEERASKKLPSTCLQPTDSWASPEMEDGIMAASSCDVEKRFVTDAPWPQVQIPISRTTDTRVDAPGLCSFVAGSGGGVLAGFFFTDTRLQHSLEVIDEDVQFREEPFEEETTTDFPYISLTDESNDGTVDAGKSLPVPAVEDLEPIDKRGNVFEVKRSSRSSPTSSRPSDLAYDLANRMTKPPNAAMLGEGSFGIVWRARDKRTGQYYAVKIISARERCRAGIAMRDADAADLVRLHPHPCLVTLYLVHHFVEVRSYMLVMEFCPKGDLGDQVHMALVASNGSVEGSARPNYSPPRLAHTWIAQSYLGLEHLHLNAGALLRDLKVENVVIDEHHRAKIIDFGLVRMSTESDGTWTFGVPPGSPGYIAPEIVKGEKYSYPADLYSFGVLVWMLLTGGVTNQEEPTPPISNPGFGFKAHAEDWRLLQNAMERPERHHARPLPCSTAKDFVTRLTQQRKDRRMNHEQIRNHAFMKPSRLPPSNVRRSEVVAWVERSMADSSQML
mmetsp:Transcript_58941/g.156903  ORF Transcript_58941/g.156903 Transcript_58941/m.156903 type:complete len:1064 (-) Transcript_58941:73-3264(-)